MDEKIVAGLIKNGTDIEEKTKTGMTALLLAAFYGNFQQKKKQNDRLDKHITLHIIISVTFCDVVYYFDFRHLFVTLGRDNIVQLLIEKGADIEKKDADGNNPLLLAISKGYFCIYKLKQLFDHLEFNFNSI